MQNLATIYSQAAADKLITGLSSEKKRWEIDLRNLQDEKEKTIGTCLVSSSFLAYTSAFSWEFRKEMVFEDWLKDVVAREIPIVLPYRIDEQLSNDVEIST